MVNVEVTPTADVFHNEIPTHGEVARGKEAPDDKTQHGSNEESMEEQSQLDTQNAEEQSELDPQNEDDQNVLDLPGK